MTVLDTPTQTEAESLLDDAGEKIFSHYAEKGEITQALVLGIPVVALCGKIWVPHRDPDKYPICPRCKKIYDALFLT
jgi:hypothetical protein